MRRPYRRDRQQYPCPIEQLRIDEAENEPHRQPLRAGLAARLLMAAMVGLREGLELGRQESEPTIMLADGLSTKDLPLDFGPLPPLD